MVQRRKKILETLIELRSKETHATRKKFLLQPEPQTEPQTEPAVSRRVTRAKGGKKAQVAKERQAHEEEEQDLNKWGTADAQDQYKSYLQKIQDPEFPETFFEDLGLSLDDPLFQRMIDIVTHLRLPELKAAIEDFVPPPAALPTRILLHGPPGCGKVSMHYHCTRVCSSHTGCMHLCITI